MRVKKVNISKVFSMLSSTNEHCAFVEKVKQMASSFLKNRNMHMLMHGIIAMIK